MEFYLNVFLWIISRHTETVRNSKMLFFLLGVATHTFRWSDKHSPLRSPTTTRPENTLMMVRSWISLSPRFIRGHVQFENLLVVLASEFSRLGPDNARLCPPLSHFNIIESPERKPRNSVSLSLCIPHGLEPVPEWIWAFGFPLASGFSEKKGCFWAVFFSSNNLEFFICKIAVYSFSVQRRRKAVCGQMIDQGSVKLSLASKISTNIRSYNYQMIDNSPIADSWQYFKKTFTHKPSLLILNLIRSP